MAAKLPVAVRSFDEKETVALIPSRSSSSDFLVVILLNEPSTFPNTKLG